MKPWKEVIDGIRNAVLGKEVREDMAQMGEYVEQFANTAGKNIQKAIDPTLSLSGKAADAAKVGEAVNAETTRAKAAEEENAKGVSQLKEDLDNIERVVTPSTDYLNFNTGTAGTGAMNNTKKFVYNSPVPKDIHFDKLSIRCRYQASATKIYVQFWKMTNDDGVYKTLECVNTVVTDVDTSSTGYKEVEIDYTTTEENYISIWADNPCLDYYTVENKLTWGVTDTASDIVTVSNAIITSYVFNGSFTQHKVLDIEAISETARIALETANSNTNEIAKIKGNLITVGANGDFTNIQDAIDYLANNVLDTAENHWTIIVYPGTYPRFTTKHARWNAYSTRYISIIGIDKSQCIVKDDSGEYNTPPAETRLYGELKNLQFIATHDNPPDVAERENAKHKAYAVHMDMGTQKLLVEDCVFTSYQAPAVGIGIWKDSEIKFKNCEFYSLGDEYTEGTDDYKTNYTYLTNHGAFFAHANMSESSGGGSAKLILENCKAYSKSGNKVYAINKSAQWYAGNTEFIVECINNNGWSDLEGIGSTSIIETGEDAITLTGNSYGNNVENMNAQTN